MKYLLIMLLALLACTANSQVSGFTFNGNNYEYELLQVKTTHFQFTICKSVTDAVKNTRTCEKKYSDYLTRDLNEKLFFNEFDKIMKALDAGNEAAMADSATKPEYETLRENFHTGAQAKAAEKTDVEKKLEVLEERLKATLETDEVNRPVGEIYLKGTTVTYEDTAHRKITSSIKDVQITIVNGMIIRKGLVVSLEDGSIFMNRGASINFPRFYKNKDDQLWLNEPKKTVSIRLGDILEYKHFGALTYPANKDVVLTPEKQRDTLHVGTALNQFLNVAVYTDLLAVLGRKPNGLIQTDITSRILSNTGSIRKLNLIFNNYWEPYIRLAKFDSKFASLDSSHIKFGGGDTVNRTYLNQIAYLRAGLKANLIKIGIGINQELFLNLGCDINLVSTDSLDLNKKKDIVFFNVYPELIYKLTPIRNFGMECGVRFNNQWLSDNTPFVNQEKQILFNPSLSLFYYPDNTENQKLYLRISFFDNFTDGRDDFAQFQLGYKTSLRFNKN